MNVMSTRHNALRSRDQRERKRRSSSDECLKRRLRRAYSVKDLRPPAQHARLLLRFSSLLFFGIEQIAAQKSKYILVYKHSLLIVWCQLIVLHLERFCIYDCLRNSLSLSLILLLALVYKDNKLFGFFFLAFQWEKRVYKEIALAFVTNRLY